MEEDEDDADVMALPSGHPPSSRNWLPVVSARLGQGDELEPRYLQVSVVSFYVVSREQERKC